jgi:hypothetical protein
MPRRPGVRDRHSTRVRSQGRSHTAVCATEQAGDVHEAGSDLKPEEVTDQL